MAILVITKGKSKETYTYTMVIWYMKTTEANVFCLLLENNHIRLL